MLIRTITVNNSQELDAAVQESLEGLLSRSSQAVLLVPGFADAVRYRRLFAKTPLSFGVAVSSFDAWIYDRWELYGDGRAVVSAVQRELLIGQVLTTRHQEGSLGELTASPGTVKLLAQAAQEALGVLIGDEPLPCAAGGHRGTQAQLSDIALTSAEHEVLAVLREYAAALKEAGLCERVQAMAALKEVSSEDLCLVVAGFDEFSHAQEQYLEALAHHASVVSICDKGASPAAMPGRAEELCALQRAIFKPDPTHPVVATGAVRFLLPAGRYAAPALIGRELVALLSDVPEPEAQEPPYANNAVLVARDPEGMFSTLAPYLARHGVSCTLSARKSFAATDFGKAFGALMRFLLKDDASISLMSDFASSLFSGLSPYRAHELDAAWRGDRSCGKGRCLTDAAAQSDLFSEVMQAWDAQGAAGALAVFEQGVTARFDWPGAYRGEQQAAVAAAQRYMQAAKDLGGDPLEALLLLEQSTVSCSAAYYPQGEGTDTPGSQVRYATDGQSARLSCESDPPGAVVRIMTLEEAASLPACSCVYVFSCEMDAQSFPVRDKQTAKTLLFEKLGFADAADALSHARRRFFRLLALPLRGLVCERELNTLEASSAYPSVMFEELIDCYRKDLVSFSGTDKATGLPEVLLPYARLAGEEALYNNLTLKDTPQEMLPLGPLPPAGVVGEEARSLIVLPRKDTCDGAQDTLFLSPSAIESYLECPYKWFTLRRLRLQGLDAGFGALEMGSFSHRVLKSVYQQLKDEGIAKIDAESLGHSREVLKEVFERHIQLQPKLRRDDNPLIACTPLEEKEVAELRTKLLRYLERETHFLPGFAPRFFERNFGDREVFEYAGVTVHGCIDRIDVDDRGQAVVIDYKGSVSKDYDYASTSPLPWVASEEAVELPNRIQTLIYAQAVRKTLGLDVAAALYVSYGRDARVSGSYDRTVLNASDLLGIDVDACGVSPEQGGGFAEVLDRTEDAIAQALEYLKDGFIEPWPRGGDPCGFCPVQVCGKRR